MKFVPAPCFGPGNPSAAQGPRVHGRRVQATPIARKFAARRGWLYRRPHPLRACLSVFERKNCRLPAAGQIPLDNDLSRRYRERFGAAILDAFEDRKQSILILDTAQLLEIARYSRDEEKFDLLEDYTA